MLVNTSAKGDLFSELGADWKLQPHHSNVRFCLHDNTASGHGANVQQQRLLLFQPLNLKEKNLVPRICPFKSATNF
jgi:hypothetical protein